jgi:hypothetical protein
MDWLFWSGCLLLMLVLFILALAPRRVVNWLCRRIW